MAHRARAVYRRQQPGPPDFVNDEAQNRYNTVKARPMIIEKGFDIPERRAFIDYIDTMVALRWQIFCAKRTEFNTAWVHEFYANAKAAENDRINVRGKQINFSAAEINNFYGTTLGEGEVDEYPLAVAEITNAQLAETICLNNEIMWKGRGERLVSSKCLNRAAKVWHIFESASIFPTSHISDFPREKAILIYCILHEKKINVGELIHERIVSIANHPGEWSLAFPCLITELCKEKEVPRRASDDMRQVPKAHHISASTITKAIKVDDEEGEGRQQQEQAIGGDLHQNDWLVQKLDRIERNQNDLREDVELIGESLRRSHIRQEELHRSYVHNQQYIWEQMQFDWDSFQNPPNRLWDAQGNMYARDGGAIAFPPPREEWATPGDPLYPYARRGRGAHRPSDTGTGSSGAGTSGAGTTRARLAPDDEDMED